MVVGGEGGDDDDDEGDVVGGVVDSWWLCDGYWVIEKWRRKIENSKRTTT